MRALSSTRLIGICEAGEEHVSKARILLDRKLSQSHDWILEGLEKGFYQKSNITVDGVERFCLIYHITDQNTLNVNAAAQITEDFSDFKALVEGMILVAKKHACNAVEGVTIRAGVFKALRSAGFKAQGVAIILPL